MRNATHQEAVAALIANVSLIKLLVRHDPPPKGLQVSMTNLSGELSDIRSCVSVFLYRHILAKKERSLSVSNNIVFLF